MPHAPTRLALILAGLLATTTAAVAGQREDVRADDAVRVVKQIQSIPESAIPDRLLDEAKAIVVVPDTIKAGFMLGGRRGLGLMSVKSPVLYIISTPRSTGGAPSASWCRRIVADTLTPLSAAMARSVRRKPK